MINYDDDDADDDDGDDDDDDDDDDDGLWWVTRQPFQRPTPFVVTQQGECQRMVTMLMGGHPRMVMMGIAILNCDFIFHLTLELK